MAYDTRLGVRVILEDELNRILILRRNADIAHGQWCLPGGKVETGQTLEDACAQEVWEETGLQLHNLSYLFSHGHYMPNIGREITDFYFTARWSGRPVCNPESDRAEWAWLADLGSYQFAFGNDAGLLHYLARHD